MDEYITPLTQSELEEKDWTFTTEESDDPITEEVDPVFSAWKNSANIVAGSEATISDEASGSVVIGRGANAVQGLATVLGGQASIQGSEIASASISLGYRSAILTSDVDETDSDRGVVSIGQTGTNYTRRIINGRAGINATDFVIKKQLDDDITATNTQLDILRSDFNELSGTVLAAIESSIASLTERIVALEDASANNVVFDSNNNIGLRDNTKIVAMIETGNGTGEYDYREILGANKYNAGTDEQFYAIEVGNPYYNTTLNTKDNLAVDTTDNGREYVQYVSNGGKNVLYGDLSATGGAITVVVGSLTIAVTRLNTTEIEATVKVTKGTDDINVPVTRILSGASSGDTVRETLVATTAGVSFDTLTVGLYVLGQYWITHEGIKYSIVIGSDNNDLSQSWMLIGTAYENTVPDA